MRLPRLATRRADCEGDPGAGATRSGHGDDGSDEVPAEDRSHEHPAFSLPCFAAPALDSALASTTRFTFVSAHGYDVEQVEEFVAQVHDALAAYETAVPAYQRALADLQVEYESANLDAQRLRSEVEVARVRAVPTTERELPPAEDTLHQLTAEVTRLRQLVSRQDQEIVALRTWGTQLGEEAQFHRLETAELRRQVEDLRSVTRSPR